MSTPDGSYPPGQPDGYLRGGPVGFPAAVRQAFGNMFCYRGRAAPSAYWWYVLFSCLAVLALSGVLNLPGLSTERGGWYAVAAVLTFGTLIPLGLVGLPLAVRRLHDSNKTGWLLLTGLIPLGVILLIILMTLDSTPGPNRFG